MMFQYSIVGVQINVTVLPVKMVLLRHYSSRIFYCNNNVCYFSLLVRHRLENFLI